MENTRSVIPAPVRAAAGIKPWLLLGLVLVLMCPVATAKPKPTPYGTRVQFFLGQPVLFPDLEVTFDGGGSASDPNGVSREYRAFRVWSKGKTVLVAWYADQTKPVDFQVAGQRYRLHISESSNPRADGALTVWKR